MNHRTKDRVRVGAYIDPLAPLYVSKGQIVAARALGVDDLWVGDHVSHVFPDELWDPTSNRIARFVPRLNAWYDPTALIARYAGRRMGLPMGTCVTDPYRRSAADLARAFMSLHHLTRGNVVLGIGVGEKMNMEAVGVPMVRPAAHLEDTLEAIRAAWSSHGEMITHKGAFHAWENAPFLGPYKGTSPPIWVASEGPRGCDIAGRLGDGWISYTFNHDMWLAAAKRVAAGAESVNKDPESMQRSLFVGTMLVANPAHLEQVMESPLQRAYCLAMPSQAWTSVGLTHPLGETFRGAADMDPKYFEGEQWEELRRLITPEVVQRLTQPGEAEQVADRIGEFVSDGVSHVVVFNAAVLGAGGPGALGVLKDALGQQRKLIRLLKKMRPGTLV